MKEYFGKPIKKLGFGLMRLPYTGSNERSPVDVEQVKQMVDHYLENGYSYFDTAYGYHGGQSEVVFRQAVTERYPRDAFQLTTKIPLYRPHSAEEMRAITDESLSRAGLDFFDLYFLHGIGPDRVAMLDQMGAWDYLQGLKAEGVAKNVGFSYHGPAEALERILEARQPGDIDIVQLQVNYLDWDSPAVQSRLCYEAVVSRGIGVIIMEPVKGGSLANFPDEVARILKAADPDASLASWAMRFCLGLEGVVSVLSGMSNLAQVQDNVKTAESFTPLSEAELALLPEVIEAIERIPLIPCTDCLYCIDECPERIPIPRIISILNDYTKYQNQMGSKRQYGFATGGGFGGMDQPRGKASDCTACGTCEQHCPQDIDIIAANELAVQLFE
jgi:predicted aldo/keto reductase-like oxidoreductase